MEAFLYGHIGLEVSWGGCWASPDPPGMHEILILINFRTSPSPAPVLV